MIQKQLFLTTLLALSTPLLSSDTSYTVVLAAAGGFALGCSSDHLGLGAAGSFALGCGIGLLYFSLRTETMLRTELDGIRTLLQATTVQNPHNLATREDINALRTTVLTTDAKINALCEYFVPQREEDSGNPSAPPNYWFGLEATPFNSQTELPIQQSPTNNQRVHRRSFSSLLRSFRSSRS